jgi:hypothetical protein
VASEAWAPGPFFVAEGVLSDLPGCHRHGWTNPARGTTADICTVGGVRLAPDARHRRSTFRALRDRPPGLSSRGGQSLGKPPEDPPETGLGLDAPSSISTVSLPNRARRRALRGASAQRLRAEGKVRRPDRSSGRRRRRKHARIQQPIARIAPEASQHMTGTAVAPFLPARVSSRSKPSTPG